MKRYTSGTKRLTLLLIKQYRWKLVLWLAGFFFVTIVTASSYPRVFLTKEDLYHFGLTVKNPAMIALLGPGYPLEAYTYGTVFANEMLLITAVIVAVMNILLASQATRRDEEQGTLEIVLSLPIGRLAYTFASIILLCVTNLLLWVSIGIGLGLQSIEGYTWNAAFLYGGLLASNGLLFGVLTLLIGQLSSTARGTTAISFAVLIIFYILRAVGDVKIKWLSFLSPLGWIGQAYVFYENQWWPIALTLLISIMVLCVAIILNQARDLYAGFLPTLKGRAQASPLLQTPFGLLLRLNGLFILSFLVILFLFGLATGAILSDFEFYFKDLPVFDELLGEATFDSVIAFLNMLFSYINVIPALIVMFHLWSEERHNRTEVLYSTTWSKGLWLGSHYLMAVVVSVFMQLTLAISLWITGRTALPENYTIGTFLMSALVYLPAMWVLIGLAALFIGLWPKGSSVVWLYLTFCFVIDYIGELAGVPDIIQSLSLYYHTPFVPEEAIKWQILSLFSVFSVTFFLIGFFHYLRRDIKG